MFKYYSSFTIFTAFSTRKLEICKSYTFYIWIQERKKALFKQSFLDFGIDFLTYNHKFINMKQLITAYFKKYIYLTIKAVSNYC